MTSKEMFFEEVRHGGCSAYFIGCKRTRAAALVDPELHEIDRYLAIAASSGFRIAYVIDTHTHADHFSSVREIATRVGVPAVMHVRSPAPYVDVRVADGETLIVGELRLRVLYTPGHTADSICVVLPDRVLTGDTLLLGGTGRSDLPTGDADALWDSLFNRLLRLDGNLLVCPGHNYKNSPFATLAQERATNPRLQKTERGAFVEQMNSLNLSRPNHLTEALRTNSTGGKTVDQLIRDAAAHIAFMGMEELRDRIVSGRIGLTIVDVREGDAFAAGHVPGAIHLPRGQLELRADSVFPDPRAHARVLRVREDLDARGRDAARDGLRRGRRARRRNPHLEGRRLPARAGAARGRSSARVEPHRLAGRVSNEFGIEAPETQQAGGRRNHREHRPLQPDRSSACPDVAARGEQRRLEQAANPAAIPRGIIRKRPLLRSAERVERWDILQSHHGGFAARVPYRVRSAGWDRQRLPGPGVILLPAHSRSELTARDVALVRSVRVYVRDRGGFSRRECDITFDQPVASPRDSEALSAGRVAEHVASLGVERARHDVRKNQVVKQRSSENVGDDRRADPLCDAGQAHRARYPSPGPTFNAGRASARCQVA